MAQPSRAAREANHSRQLAGWDPEATWGWGSPAGQIRARRRAGLLVQSAGLEPGVRALEIGCGTGRFTVEFARTGALLVAIELSGELLATAQARPELQGVELLQGAFETTPLPGPFDAVLGSSVLHHLPTAVALRRIYDLLRPGGVLCFAEPNMLNPQVYLERHLRSWFPYVSPDETAFSRWSLRRALMMAGFTAVSISPFDWLHPATPASLISMVGRAGRVLERVPAVREFAGSLLIRGVRQQ
jgi:2-polyprenyl-3-methyl-5-hydroxy-6-metoxy-1,4-benzoquinol methylase